MLDLLIRDGTIVDGSGNPRYKANVGIKDGKIVSILRTPVSAVREINAQGQFVVPGFVDIHTHSDMVLYRSPRVDMKIRQGATTEVDGNCGYSPAPLTKDSLPLLGAMPWAAESVRALGHFEAFGEYLDRLASFGVCNNHAILVGHVPLRTAAMGWEPRAAISGEIDIMKAMLADALDDGGAGLSVGLLYPPMTCANVDELAELCQVVASRGKIFSCHMRDYGVGLIDSTREMIQIAERSGVAVHISHLIVTGRASWGTSEQMLAMVDEARARGLDITLDQHPYNFSASFLFSLLPPWMHQGGLEETVSRLRDPEQRARARMDIERGMPGWQDVVRDAGWEALLVISEHLPQLSGKSFAEIAEARGVHPTSVLFDTMLEDRESWYFARWLSEDDIEAIMRHPLQMVASDSMTDGPKTHPRSYGAFPKVLGEYVREKGVLSWEEAIRKMTFFPASRFNLDLRGLIAQGFSADIVIFDPQTVGDRATAQHPNQYPTGIGHVIVNGHLAVEQGEYDGSVSGEVLRLA